MADSPPGSEAGSGKASKKNQKKRKNKAKNSALVDPGKHGVHGEPEVDPIEELRQRLADAKLNKDHGQASKLRQQLWIVQDLAAGVTPRVDPGDEEGLALVREFQKTGIISLSPRDAAPAREEKVEHEQAPVSSSPAAGGGGEAGGDKRLKNLNKKLKQIEALKERQRNGETLEANQLEKIKLEAAVRKELRETEELISKLMAEIKR